MSSAAGAPAIKGRLCERTQPVVVQLGGGVAGRRADGLRRGLAAGAAGRPAGRGLDAIRPADRRRGRGPGDVGRRRSRCAAVPGPGQPAVRTGARPETQLAQSQRPLDRSAKPWRCQHGRLPARRRSAPRPPLGHRPGARRIARLSDPYSPRRCGRPRRLRPPRRPHRPGIEAERVSLAPGARRRLLRADVPRRGHGARTDSRPRRRRGTVQQRGAVLDARLPVRGRPPLLRPHRRRRPVRTADGPARRLRSRLLDAGLARGVARDRRRYAANHDG